MNDIRHASGIYIALWWVLPVVLVIIALLPYIRLSKLAFSIIRGWAKKLTMYYLIIQSGIKNESTAEKEFLEIEGSFR